MSFDREQAERNVRALEDREIRSSQSLVDLSPNAIAKRREAATDPEKNPTGRELIARAARVFDAAQKLQKTASRRPPGARRTRRMSERADEALRSAALQIRVAAMTPLDRPYLHALPLDRVQAAEEEVVRAFANDPAALAVDTHRRIRDQRMRAKIETEDR